MCLEAGLTQGKNSINVSLKNAIDFCLSFLMYWVFGYGIMFGITHGGMFGSFSMVDETSIVDLISFFFQASFCATSATIVSGAVAERIRLLGYLFLVLVISLVIYPLFGHWAWASDESGVGWLKNAGFIDFAGSTVVHSVGGWVSLAGCIFIGPRLGFKEGMLLPSNLNLYPLGVFLLLVGWFGFNGGSVLAFDGTVPLFGFKIHGI